MRFTLPDGTPVYLVIRHDVFDRRLHPLAQYRACVQATAMLDNPALAGGVVLANGSACCTWNDNYSRRKGTQIAMQRLVKQLAERYPRFDKAARTAFWSRFWNRKFDKPISVPTPNTNNLGLATLEA